MKKIAILLGAALAVCGCWKSNDNTTGQAGEETRQQRYSVNLFAYNMMNSYYLWVDEIQDGLKSWGLYDDPVATVAKIRYKDAEGKDIDRWTMVTDDYNQFAGSVSGNTTTCGFEFSLYYTDATQSAICAVVTFTYADSPAEQAGLRRGDTIVEVNGKAMTPDTYYAIITEELLGGGPVRLTFSDGSEKTLSPVSMYENPVGARQVFSLGGKKVGYLHYSSFTLDSCEDLITVCREFKQEGISELVLDLRYNGGGYVRTEQVLASMLAPAEAVQSGAVFTTEVYNAWLTENSENADTCFETEYDFQSDGKTYQFSTADANLGLDKLYVLITGSSASASESLICGLLPYMDITLIGSQSYGKYCGGIILSGPQWYDAVKDQVESAVYENGIKYSDNWGIYVMYSRYADKDGNTLSMPDGITPEIAAADRPQDGDPLGSPDEAMLSVALALAEGRQPAQARLRAAGSPVPILLPKFRERILPVPESLPVRL